MFENETLTVKLTFSEKKKKNWLINNPQIRKIKNKYL